MDVSNYHLYQQLPGIVKAYQFPDNRKAVIQILDSILPFLVIWVAMYLLRNVSIWLTIGLAVVNAFFLVRIFIIQHDCGHQSFTASRKVNNIIGTACSLLTFIPFKYWAKVHNYHHGHNGILDENRGVGDIYTLTVKEFRELTPIKKLKYQIFRNAFVLFVLGPLIYLFYYNRLPLIQHKNIKSANRSLLWSNLALLAFHAALVFFLGWQAFLRVQLPILMVFGTIALWFFYVQHQHRYTYKSKKENWDFLLASIRGSSYYKLPRFVHWLSGNIGYHHIHHLSSLVPSYHLARCHHENPIFEQLANALTFKESLRCIFYKLWDEDNERMVTWREYHSMNKAV
jgi:acyl-lipid omega-6 desaturase (Delta-12 desaturase)